MDRSIVYEVGDIVKLKKPHPCGSQEWEIMRVGADFRLKCHGMRTSDHGGAEAGGEKYQRAEKARRPASKIEKADKKLKRKNTKKAAKSP